jgi:NADPH:quinone reductase-like Zn-dependent oxidoreductase
VAANGRIALIGNLGGKLAPGQAMPALGRNASTLRGILSGSASMLERVLQAYALNRAKPWIDRHFTFAEAAAAYSFLEAGNFFGKIVIDV